MRTAPSASSADDVSLVARLSLEQKIRLLTGKDSWVLHGLPEIGLRPLVTSDGPAGVRGTRFDRENPSSSLPSPIALGATWDEGLVEEVAFALGGEARSKGVDVLLAPTVNIVRTPLSGRGFECLAEDPVLTSRIAVAYVRGVQRSGIAATVKHFVANDTETDRRSYDARIAEQVLRELYLPPFEACVNEANVALVMAAYNSVNGAPMTANRRLLHDLLKTEWEFSGVVVSDWSATRTTAPSALAGLDLVMPGPAGPWGDHLLAAVREGRVDERDIDDKVARLLGLARRVGALNGSVAPEAPALIDPSLLRAATARSFVLLSNPRRLLPVDVSSLRKVALIGPNAIAPTTQGGGSIRVVPVVGPSLAEAIGAALGEGVSLEVQPGCITAATVALPEPGTISDPVTGAAGVRLEVRSRAGAIIHDGNHAGSVVTWWDGLPDAVHLPDSRFLMRTRYRAAVSGPHLIGGAGVGRARLSVDGVMLAEATSLPPRDVVEALSRPPELRAPISLQAGQEVEVNFELRPDVRDSIARFATMRLGITPNVPDDVLLDAAARAATAADLAVVVVGSPDGTESEGFDRESLRLSGRQDELVSRVAAANPNTVVVVNSGAPVLMPWCDEVGAILQVWLPGQAFAEALADVLVGGVEPGGRLPVSFPRAEADSPVLHAKPEAGELPYSEGLLVGYRGYDRAGVEPLFCFGHGLGYTEWRYLSVTPEASVVRPGEDLPVLVEVENTGSRAGREVIQAYLEGPDLDPRRPLRVLAGFAAVEADAGENAKARLTLPGRLFARFDETLDRWVWPAGSFTLRVGRSSRDLRLAADLTLTA